MPIYEYQCQACGHELEALQKIADAPLVDCPECSEAALKKKVSAAAFRLKGGGWYETDFKTGNKKNLAGDGDKSSSGGASANDGKSSAAESKPAEKKSTDKKASDGKKSA